MIDERLLPREGTHELAWNIPGGSVRWRTSK